MENKECFNLYQQWADAFTSIGSSHISNETAAKILAVVNVYGGSFEGFTHCPMLTTDLKAATRMFNIDAGETPTLEGVMLIKKYVHELEDDIENSSIGEDSRASFNKICHVEWANRLFKERYGFEKLML